MEPSWRPLGGLLEAREARQEAQEAQHDPRRLCRRPGAGLAAPPPALAYRLRLYLLPEDRRTGGREDIQEGRTRRRQAAPRPEFRAASAADPAYSGLSTPALAYRLRL